MARHTSENGEWVSLINCGHGVTTAPCDKMHLYGRHFHECYEMLLLIKGDIHYNVDGVSYALRPYDLVLIPPSTYHFAVPMSNEDYEKYIISIKMPLVGNERLQKLFSPPYVMNIAGDSQLRRMFSLLDFYFERFETKDFEEASEHLVNALLISLSYKAKEGTDISYAPDGNNLIAQITAFIAQNLNSDLNADIIAKHFNFSRSYVQNRFSKVMGIGLKQYINQKKIYAAHTDIQLGMSPNEVAQKYCFTDYSSFFRHYKKIFGMSPMDSRC